MPISGAGVAANRTGILGYPGDVFIQVGFCRWSNLLNI